MCSFNEHLLRSYSVHSSKGETVNNVDALPYSTFHFGREGRQ